jgi:3-hydroxyacyl-CoA dehydrogenase
MSNFIVRKVAVLGAGVMGAQIAAHLVNAGVEAVLFDLPAREGPKNAIATKAIEALKKMNPAPLGHPDLAAHIVAANYDDDLERLRDCELVIEAIAERMDWKHDLYRKVAPYLGADVIFATNTSGLSIAELAQGLDAALRARFCGVHFFNPPRYMHLVELIPTPDTRADVVDRLEAFLTTTLGKGCIRAKDTPNFIANRIGIYGMLATIEEARRFGLTYDVVDDLTGKKLGRAGSGTFRTADLVGLDTVGHVIRTMQDNLKDDPFHPLYATPEAFAKLIGMGALGNKTGGGFYRKSGKAVVRFDVAKGDYVPAGAKADDELAKILKTKSHAERLKLLRASANPQAQFVWSILRDSWHYAAVKLAEVAECARDVDLAMRFGFGMSEGPFEAWQQAGWLEVAGWIQADIDAGRALCAVPLPKWVTEGKVAERGGVHQRDGSYSPARDAFVPRAEQPVLRRQLFPEVVAGEGMATGHNGGNTLFEDDSIRLWTLPGRGVDDVVIASIRSKAHAIGPGVIAGLLKGVELAERDYRGMVIWMPDDPFSYGADLKAMMPVFMSGGVDALGGVIQQLQEAMLRLRYAQVPTVAAVANMALGGGLEMAMYCSRRVAHLESYVGLVEVGVGLIPAGGGLAFGARRAAEEQSRAPDANLLDFLKKYFMAAGTAQVAKSALEAQAMGYLLPDDRIVFHRQELLYAAIREVKAMSDAGWRPPRPAKFRVAGRDGVATIMAQLVNMREGAFVSEHDTLLGRCIAEAMCGGDVEPGSVVDERWVMALERKAFVSLLKHPKTQERIMGMMTTGKPVRN